MTERQFDIWQQEVIAISGGRHLVLAPPGCGKTDILTERVVHAHAAGIDYADMLCLTFTNRAAKGMARRIADRTGNPVPDALFVGNIHRFCSQMLFTEGVVNHNSAIIDESDVDNIVQEELCRRMNIECRSTELMRLQHALLQAQLGMESSVVLHGELLHTGAMSKLCMTLGVPPSEAEIGRIYGEIDSLVERYTVLDEMPAARLMLLARAYQRYKEDNDLLDYDDLLVLAYQHLRVESGERRAESSEIWLPHPETSELRTPNSALQTKKYRWIEIDEVQDLNALQFALVEKFATDDATIVYLGDEQQAIFSFIGAKLETLETLKRRCAGHIHHLHTNYRSPQYLLDLQNDYAAKNLKESPESSEFGVRSSEVSGCGSHISELRTPKSQDLCLIDVGDSQLESYYAARFAKRYGEMDPDGRVAVLVSTNREADDVGDSMTALGVSHFKISGTDLFSLPPMRMLLAHLSVLTDETVFIAWARLLWGLHVTPTYTAARALMRDLRRRALLPTDFLLYPESSYLQEFVRAYEEEELVIFDTETTGLDPREDDIIQIAAIRVRKGRIVGKPFNIIMETSRELPQLVGGNPNPMLQVYRDSHRHPRAEGLRMFLDYCRGSVLVGHNVEYDYQILRNNLMREFGVGSGEWRAESGELACATNNSSLLTPHSSLPTTYFDTLKYIRLVRPRLRHYKLVHLIETLHLQGENSHKADDDVLATKSLLDFCHAAALPMVAEQRMFTADHRRQIDTFAEKYADIYHHARRRMYLEGSGIAEELQYMYDNLLRQTDPIDKWPHFMQFLRDDMVREELYPTLRTQLERYSADLGTCREADLCGGSFAERYIISTVHKAKGLEFDAVIVYRAVDGSYPGQRSWTEKQIQEDARRLFVAISRSCKRLCVIYDSYHGSTHHALSPFLEKVKGHFTLFHRDFDGKIRCRQ